MPTIKRTAMIPYSARQMFELVNDIPKYSEFLIWCSQSTVLEANENKIVGSLEISWAGMRKNFTTSNELHPFERIDITLVQGPFRSLKGSWNFSILNENACRISLELEFEFTGSLMDRLFQPIFNNIANSLVEAFSNRALEVYGKNND